ncbi:hypothetical protein BT96DRAFT_949636 [Gymnopus androsaceus JB14]|uniref:Uncharacterized protein n=1 Tax=Gymnopus androsaceus JB14 TaxID=1447944 RepID=A0A6A4GJ34_9AGAR|nr:hypothetical protein BT96DRAFT_949636 [Gymnopus androsaceus JB14]
MQKLLQTVMHNGTIVYLNLLLTGGSGELTEAHGGLATVIASDNDIIRRKLDGSGSFVSFLASGPITYIFPYEPSAFGARKHSKVHDADITELVAEQDDDNSADDASEGEEKPVVEELPMTLANTLEFLGQTDNGIRAYLRTKKLHYSRSTFTLPETRFPVPQKLLAAIAALGDSDPNPDPHPPVPLDRLFASIAGAEIVLNGRKCTIDGYSGCFCLPYAARQVPCADLDLTRTR